MNDLINQNNFPTKKRTTLSQSLLRWFLLLSLLPLLIVSWISYQQANSSLTKSSAESLEYSSLLSVRFMQNWFRYRIMDLNNQAELKSNTKLLKLLISDYKKSAMPLSEYVKSESWSQRTEGLQHDLINLRKRYDYIYDLFLIDTKGNVLFSIARESDLGTNLFNGRYAKTLFAASVKLTHKTGEALFSDLERYKPSNNIIAGFLTAPLLDESGNKLGVFAIQIRVEKIFQSLKRSVLNKSSLTHYLVGIDGKLRTSLYGDSEEILNRVINTEQVKYWQKEYKQGINKTELEEHKELAFEYIGPNGKYVIGYHKTLHLPGVKWVLVSEIDRDEALAAASWLAKTTSILVILTVIIVVIIALYIARRITQPIRLLLDASIQVADGNINQSVKVSSDNEIGQLAESFNRMMLITKRHEQELEQTAAQAEAAFQEFSEQKFAFDQHAIVAVTDVKGTITQVNQKFCDISGYPEAELIGQNHHLLNSGFHDVTFFKDMYHNIVKGKVWHAEICNKAKDGHLYWVDTTVVPFMGENGKPKNYIAIRSDITKRKETEIELVKSKEVAEAATLQKSEFLANMSHEIRTPMNGIIGMTGLLLDSKLNPKQRNQVETTMSSAEALLAIINDILDFSKIEAGKMDLELLPFNLQLLMEDVAEIMAMKCREKGLEMLLHFKPETVKNVVGDPGRVRQILLNLLSNAIKFTEQGNVVLTVESEKVINGKSMITVSVIDSGIGIDDDKLDKIFNKFDQEDGSTTRKYGGTGLGLAICRQLCQLMGGDIKVESHKGQGSEFTFTLNLAVSDEKPISSIMLSDNSTLEGIKTLIVDDIAIARDILYNQLSSLKLNIDMVDSANSALDKLANAIKSDEPYDIVITDFHMPEMDGEMLAAEIKQRKLLENGALLFITSSPRKGDGSRLKKLGFDGYLTKPTRAIEVPQILSLLWNAKLEGKELPLVTRHMVQEVKAGNKKKLKLKNTHILLAEDNPVNQMVAIEYLERYGCSVSPAGNGLEAVAEFKNSTFDLVFMDCQMPEMDGYEATGIINEWEKFRDVKHTPIIAFTANAMQGDKEHCLAAGMDDYISKPVSEKSLEDILKKWLPYKVELIDYVDEELNTDNKQIKQEFVDEEFVQLDLSVFHTLKNMFGNAFVDAVASHTSSAKDNVGKMEEALNNNDANQLEHAAHSLKGASAQFGAMQLSELAQKMEEFGKKSQIEKAKEIIEALKQAREAVEALMQKETS